MHQEAKEADHTVDGGTGVPSPQASTFGQPGPHYGSVSVVGAPESPAISYARRRPDRPGTQKGLKSSLHASGGSDPPLAPSWLVPRTCSEGLSPPRFTNGQITGIAIMAKDQLTYEEAKKMQGLSVM